MSARFKMSEAFPEQSRPVTDRGHEHAGVDEVIFLVVVAEEGGPIVFEVSFQKVAVGRNVVGGDAAVERVGDVDAGDDCGRMGSCEFAGPNASAGAEVKDPVRLGKRIGQRGEMEGLKARDEDGVLGVEAFRLCRGLIGERIDTFMLIEMFSEIRYWS